MPKSKKLEQPEAQIMVVSTPENQSNRVLSDHEGGWAAATKILRVQLVSKQKSGLVKLQSEFRKL